MRTVILSLLCVVTVSCSIGAPKSQTSSETPNPSAEIKRAAEEFLIKPVPARTGTNADAAAAYYVARVNGVAPSRVDADTYIVDVDVTRNSGETDIVRIVCRRFMSGDKSYWKGDDCPRNVNMPRPCNLPIAADLPRTQ
jgi:hypothetical protein